jgi:GrpB-like predicted nucleotidyltransferase (UPF0157 family)
MAYEDRKYSIVPYRNEWPRMYKAEAGVLRAALEDDIIDIEHVGGTAVPGLTSKPTIDILVIVKDLKKIDAYEFSLKSIGYDALGAWVVEHSRFFKKDRIDKDGRAERLVNLHVFPEEHPATLPMIDVRDYLIAHPEEAGRYGEFKEKLFRQYPNNCLAYQEDKKSFIAELAKKASRWKDATQGPRHFPHV